MSLYIPRISRRTIAPTIARLVHDHPFATLITSASPEPLVTHLPLTPRGRPRAARHAARPFRARQSALADRRRRPSRSRSSTARTRMCRRRGTPIRPARCRHGTTRSCTPTERCSWRATRRDTRGARSHDPPLRSRAPCAVAARTRRGSAARDGGCDRRLSAEVKRIEAKFKLSQNRSPEDRGRVAAALAVEQHADSVATAAWMRGGDAPESGFAGRIDDARHGGATTRPRPSAGRQHSRSAERSRSKSGTGSLARSARRARPPRADRPYATRSAECDRAHGGTSGRGLFGQGHPWSLRPQSPAAQQDDRQRRPGGDAGVRSMPRSPIDRDDQAEIGRGVARRESASRAG